MAFPINILHIGGAFIKSKKPTLIYNYYLNSRFYLDFTGFCTSVLFLSPNPIQGTTLHLDLI